MSVAPIVPLSTSTNFPSRDQSVGSIRTGDRYRIFFCPEPLDGSVAIT